MRTELRQVLEQVAWRFRHVRLWSSLAVCWLIGALVGLAVLIWQRQSATPFPIDYFIPGILAPVLFSAFVCGLLALRSARDPRWVARRIEAKHPELRTGLLAAVEQDGSHPSGRLGFLQTAVIREALEHHRHHNWEETVPTRTLRATRAASTAAMVGLIAVFAALGLQAHQQAQLGTPGARQAASFDVKVEPGNTEIERGTALLVVVRFGGTVPGEATLVFSDQTHADAQRPMARSLQDPMFAGRVESVETDLAYHVEFAGRSTETFHVRVFEYPELVRTDARLVFPGYTSLAPTVVEDIRHVTAVEGTELTLLCRLNKEVATARLVDAKAQVELALERDAEDDHLYRTTFKLTDPRRFQVNLVDREGRSSKQTAEIVVNVTRNRPALVKMSQPSRDVRVSPVEELKLRANLEDDFGLVRHGLSYSLGGDEPREIVLGAPAGAGKKVQAEHLLDFESLHAVPDQLVSYFFWAEDIGPDGQPRRSSGDMYFAEVRYFEEIFRQGEQPPSGSESEEQNGNAQQATRLAELQKEIINGTWKLIRRETGAKPSAKFTEDSKTLQESQHTVIEQAGELGQQLRDATSKASLDQAVKFMKEAEKRLTEAVESSSIAAHRPALTSEQAAYQALLKLRAREFEVIRNNRRSRSRGGSAGSPADRQLQELELTNEENRYEEQRSARARQENQTQREREQAENRQVLNRLRELAQRQSDLNDRLKEIQSALEAAKDPQTRAELERQLKRLRDQEQQILRDADELRERMEREENRDRMADARQQMEQGREHVRQASEALEEGRLSQAVTEGARAGRQLNDLREELRKSTSNRFAEEMTEMRDQARRLDENQDRISQEIDAWNRRARQSLRDTQERTQTRQALDEQRKQLDQLLDRMKSTVQDAEETEPLLAKNLYDAVRKANEQSIPEALRDAEQLVDLGVGEEAIKSSRRAGQGIDQLREGVERAARSVLGDETAALKRAQGELEDLADQINREIARATGSENSPRPGRDGQNDPNSNQPRRQGQNPQQEGQPGEQAEQGQQGQQEGQRDQQGQQGEQGQQGQQGQQKGQGRLRGGNNPRGGEQQKGQQGQPGQGQQEGRMAGQQRGGDGGPDRGSALDRMLDGLARGGGPGNPITGEGFRQWSDRMRDVEELLDNPELRAEAARIRDRVRGTREEFRRHSKLPDWNQLQDLVADPLLELRNRIAEEVRRRESPDALVPIDRDPVPPQFAEGVRRYYERLGSGQ
jgi:hypothetical protein